MDQVAQLDFATLALRGKRYGEAESIYMQIAMQNNSPEAWLGIGMCKLYQLSEGRTMEEVTFCMNKAKQIAPSMESEINTQLIINCKILIAVYVDVFEQCLAKHKQLRNQAKAGALLAGVSIVAGLNSKSAFGTIASLAGTGAGVGVAVDAMNKMQTVNEVRDFILSKCDQINNSIYSHVNAEDSLLEEYKEYVDGVILDLQEAIRIDETSQKWYMDKTTLVILTIFLWPVGLYGWYKRSQELTA